MNKRITSLLLCFVMVFAMLATAVPALAAPITSTQLKVVPDKTTASPGDTITYTIIMGPVSDMGSMQMALDIPGPVSDMGSMQMALDIPTGLTYVENSGKLTDGLKTTLGFETADWTEVTKMVTGFAVDADYESATDTELAKFQCKVDDGATGSLEVGLTNLEFGSCQTFEYHTDRFSVEKTAVTITAAPKPATDITLDQEELTLTVGDTETLMATVTPPDTTDTVAWSSNKPEVATVDPTTGNVNAVAPGEAIITAKAGSVSATCTVKVSCAHNLETVPAKDSNCTDKGWDEYQKCTLCGALFDMSGGSRSDIPYRPLNDDHDFNMSEWGYQGDDGHAHVCTRNPAHHDTVEAHNFGADDICDICGYERMHVCANHLTKVDRVEADCTNPGNIEHYKCSCGKLYEDATAARELTEEDVNRGALGHDWIDATCTEPKTCDRCGETEGTALGHDWEGEWSSNADNHWHACTRCDAKDGEAAHNPGAPATETTPQTCTNCGYVITPAIDHVHASHLTLVPEVPDRCTEPGNIAYYRCSCGNFYRDRDALSEIEDHDSVVLNALGHNWATEWSSNADNHWHACSRCDAKDGEGAHNPGAPATETTPQTCTDCGYVIDPATGHLCINHLVEVPEVPATCTTTGTEAHFKCTDPACGKLYWDDDTHDPIEDRSELVIDVLDHAWADTWSKDEHNHWHACSRCDAKADEAAHTPDRPAATETDPIKCIECGYVMEEQLEEGDIRIVLPFTLTVKKTGDLDPNAQTFSFVAEEFGAPVDCTLVQSTLDTNGVSVYNGSFVFTIRESDKDNLREGFVFRQVRGSAAGWTYDETKFYAVPIYNENGDGVEFWNIYYLDEEGMPDEDNRPNGVSFTNSYVPTNSNVPQTGDDSNLAFWIVLLLAGGCGAVIAGFRKKGNSDEE